MNAKFFEGKKILITGHTGFKGTWMCQILNLLGADITGYALQPPTTPNLFSLSNMDKNIKSVIGDIRDIDKLKNIFIKTKPEIVIHMAAQPLVRESYQNPVDTYAINVMGTVNVLECVRSTESIRSVINVTTDKVYLNKEWEWGYRENEELNGHDPYSNSKSCSELVTSSYKKSYFQNGKTAVSTARAGNVIGGGDFSKDRIIPDCIQAIKEDRKILVRNPYSVRPYQHVLEPLMAYLMIAEAQHNDRKFEGTYNIGPDDINCLSTGELVNIFCEEWKTLTNYNIEWESTCHEGPHEANCLKLDSSKLKNNLKWKPCWNIRYSMKKLVELYEKYFNNADILNCMECQSKEYLAKMKQENMLVWEK